LLAKSKAQLRQDLFVLSETNFLRGGYFVEFGATNGIDLSNTYLLEKEYRWSGILAEPATVWKRQLNENRPNSFIENRCVWSASNCILTFNETNMPELSTIDSYSLNDRHGGTRLTGHKYDVMTISLNDLLKKYKAPKYIDYLSIDTEGTEFEILNAFDFNEWTFGIITIEHNYTPSREMIFSLLSLNGYERKHQGLSRFDDWYVKIR
jgi:FkbM family methyltransferase